MGITGTCSSSVADMPPPNTDPHHFNFPNADRLVLTFEVADPPDFKFSKDGEPVEAKDYPTPDDAREEVVIICT